jgi:hypothetical protein
MLSVVDVQVMGIYRLFRQPLRSEVLSFEWKTSGNRMGTVVNVCATRAPMRLRNRDGDGEKNVFDSRLSRE